MKRKFLRTADLVGHNVAPHAGAWIETGSDWATEPDEESRPPRGGVD